MRLKEVLKFILFLAVFSVLLIFLRQHAFTPVIVKGDSMDPTLHDGERVIALKNKEISRFDVVTFKAPDEPGKNYIKRVIGLPGEKIEYVNDVLYVNGTAYEEPYLEEYKDKLTDNELLTEDFTMDLFQVSEIPEGKLLVLGDNRKISKDSRIIGLIDQSALLGDVKLIFWPLDEFGMINR